MKLLIFAILFLQMLRPSRQGTISSYTCRGGGKPGGISTNRCSPRNGPDPKCISPPRAPSTLRETEGCELDSAATGNYFCCPQYCDDGLTMIYYEDLENVAPGGGATTLDKPKTPECTGPGTCPSDRTKTCFLANSDDGRYFCCPSTTPPATGTGTGTGPAPAGSGSSATCQDVGGMDCLTKDYLCDNQLYFDLMTFQCPLTCKRCPADGSQPTRPPNIVNAPLPNANCKDMLDCPTWKKNGFCENTFYTRDTKAVTCPLSCQLGCALPATSGK